MVNGWYVVNCKIPCFFVKLLLLEFIHILEENWRTSTNFQGEGHIRLMVKMPIQENDEDKDYFNDCGCIQVAKSVLLELTHFWWRGIAIYLCVWRKNYLSVDGNGDGDPDDNGDDDAHQDGGNLMLWWWFSSWLWRWWCWWRGCYGGDIVIWYEWVHGKVLQLIVHFSTTKNGVDEKLSLSGVAWTSWN